MFEKLYIKFGDYFNEIKENGGDCWCIINCAVAVSLLNELYIRFIKDGITPIESLTQEEKVKYWGIGKKYYPDQKQAVMGSKAAYVLSLITAN